jgi:hypothetical protein
LNRPSSTAVCTISAIRAISIKYALSINCKLVKRQQSVQFNTETVRCFRQGEAQ